MLGELGELVVIIGGEQPLLDAQLANRDLECLEIADFVDHGGGGVVAVMVIVRHLAIPFRVSAQTDYAGSSQRSENSVCKESLPKVSGYSGQRSFCLKRMM